MTAIFAEQANYTMRLAITNEIMLGRLTMASPWRMRLKLHLLVEHWHDLSSYNVSKIVRYLIRGKSL